MPTLVLFLWIQHDDHCGPVCCAVWPPVGAAQGSCGGRSRDWLVVAATGSEQIAALPRSLERFPPAQVLWAGTPDGTHQAGVLRETLVASQVPITAAQAGQALELGAGARLRVLSVCKRGAVLLLEWKNFQALLPLGLDFDTLEAL